MNLSDQIKFLKELLVLLRNLEEKYDYNVQKHYCACCEEPFPQHMLECTLSRVKMLAEKQLGDCMSQM